MTPRQRPTMTPPSSKPFPRSAASFECYGWPRVRAELRHRGMIVNHKKIRRLMREHGLQPRIRRRYVATTDSDHDQPIYPNRTKT
jgi:putative transposase